MIDADGDGVYTSPRGYARSALAASGADVTKLFEELAPFDEAIASQAAHEFQERTGDLLSEATQTALKAAAPQVRAGFTAYTEAWRATQIAKVRQQ
jgi:hypothetical protein